MATALSPPLATLPAYRPPGTAERVLPRGAAAPGRARTLINRDTPRTHDRSGRDRSAQRAAELLMLEGMHRLDSGDPERAPLRRQVIAQYMPYARYLASRYDSGHIPAEDLHQVAYVGLVKAVDNFDPDFGCAFLSYATPMITGELKRYFRDHSWAVHVPRRIQELCGDVRPAVETLQQRLKREPTTVELAGLLGAEPRDVLDAIDAAGLRTSVSLDVPIDTGEGSGTLLGDLFGADDPGIQSVVDRETLRPLLARLTPREKQILLMTFYKEMSQTQIGAELGVSQMQISRLLAAILAGLRRRAGAEETR